MVFRKLALVAALLFGATAAAAQETQPTLTGDTRIHDPSVIEIDGKFAAFQTGQEGGIYGGAIRAKTSPDGIGWRDAGSIGKGLPKWVRETLDYQPPNIWAPSVSKHGEVWNLYYSISSFGINTSAIGLMTNTALDTEKPGEGWQDQGVVLQSGGRDNFNAIDPWRIDTGDGRAFLAFGSFWDGIKMRELDPATGKLLAEEAPLISLASRQGAGIEAASILEHDGKFYLFVSFDQCCKGVASTYNIRVGRADAVTGPYLDKDGKPMLRGGGHAPARHHRPLHRPRRARSHPYIEWRHARLPLLRPRRPGRVKAPALAHQMDRRWLARTRCPASAALISGPPFVVCAVLLVYPTVRMIRLNVQKAPLIGGDGLPELRAQGDRGDHAVRRHRG